MITEILLKVLVGVAAGAAAAGATYAIYKKLTKDQIKEDVQKQLQHEASEEQYSQIFDIKIKQKVEKGETYSVDDIDKWAEEDTVIVDVRDKERNTVFSDITVTGDEIGEDVHVGTVIKLYD